MNNTYQNHTGITGVHMLTHYLKLLAIKLPATLLAGFTLLTLSIQPAHADFRKALTAYQNRDGQTMLKEVQDAVDTKNDDGLILFLSVLETDKWVARISDNNGGISAPLDILFGKDILNFIEELNHVVLISSIEAKIKYHHLWLAYVYDGGSGYIRTMREEDFINKINIKEYGRIEEKLSPTAEKLHQARLLLTGDKNSPYKPTSIQIQAQAMRLLKQALKKPDAYLYWNEVAYPLSQYYLEKYRKTKKTTELKQAYLWAMQDIASHEENQSIDTLYKLHQQGLLQIVAPEVDAYFRNGGELNDSQPSTYPSGTTRLLQSNIKAVEMPSLIKHYKLNLNQTPVISFIKSDNPYCTTDIYASARDSLDSYRFDVYQDGRLNLILGKQCGKARGKLQGETLIKISREQVAKLLQDFETLGFSQAPLLTPSPQKIPLNVRLGMTDTAIYGNYNVTMVEKNNLRTVQHASPYKESINGTPFFIKAFALLDKLIPTQQYRCGTEKNSKFYAECVKHDNLLMQYANQGENK